MGQVIVSGPARPRRHGRAVKGSAALAVLAAACLMLAAGIAGAATGPLRWTVYYSDQAPTSAFEPFDIVVLDTKHHPPLRPLLDRGKMLLGYISLGEAESHRSHFEAVKAQGLLVRENEVWKGSYFVDVRDKRWTARVVEELLPQILRAGFDGIFIDTLDNAGELERNNAKAYKGMATAAAQLVRAIRLNYPSIKIMVNRAYEILPEVGPAVDMVVGESVYTTYDFKTKAYRKVSPNDYAWQVKQLRDLKQRFPHLLVMSLDYWNPEDDAVIKEVYGTEEGNGFNPYVATIELDRVVARPAP